MKKVPILSDEWNALWVAEAATLQPGPGPTGSLEVSLRRDDEHILTFTTYFVDGRMHEVVARGDDNADLRVEVPESAWHSICEGHHEVLEKMMLNGQMRLIGRPRANDDAGAGAVERRGAGAACPRPRADDLLSR